MRRMTGLGIFPLLFVAACGGAAAPAARGPILSSPSPQMAVEEGPNAGRGPDGPVTPEERNAAIDALLKNLDARYVFPEKAKLVRAAVEARRKRGEYDKLTTGHALATTLTTHVNEVLKDAHFRVRYHDQKIPEAELQTEPTAAERERFVAEGDRLNGGFERVERLPGNIGYVEVRSFSFLGRGVEAAAAAMNFVAETDALIIDLRRNGGGDPELVAALCSYFFDGAVHLNDIYDRPKNETRQFWTSPTVPGKRYLGKDVYVLTSKRTGSGAEEFAYDLQTQKRAVIIGEKTWGGANPGEVLRLGDHLAAFVPSGRAINPITKTNWEGVGVLPDIAVPPEDALRVAQVRALQKRIAAATEPELKKSLEERLHELESGEPAKPAR
ncbi:S41 family peptidase [Polyangium jinanense]|uniref:S41 family peptidase n=1 Tax=Polyangium jinanense TaxID=2829994 RepID=A0A9X4AZK3_9BACT|nr:S41 family peptidase [Polyangium jinanense]MDC3961746.1 S41 family peptidase [Polyangium jinanense]MDC3988252.1 S41 family peptidase [Polyangium jinanense]